MHTHSIIYTPTTHNRYTTSSKHSIAHIYFDNLHHSLFCYIVTTQYIGHILCHTTRTRTQTYIVYSFEIHSKYIAIICITQSSRFTHICTIYKTYASPLLDWCNNIALNKLISKQHILVVWVVGALLTTYFTPMNVLHTVWDTQIPRIIPDIICV